MNASTSGFYSRANLLAFAFALGLLALGRCGQTVEQQLVFYNHGDSARYVGLATCASCHPDHAEGFSHTGMGLSLRTAWMKNSAIPGTARMYDSTLNFHYVASFERDSLYIHEFRLDGKDTVHSIKQKVDWIIGSGHHTNSHLFGDKGFVFQAPFTYYTQRGVADLPPGFEQGANSRFSRLIGLECMSCHNAMPTGFVAGSENKYTAVPLGIDCERCHGPGSLHVNKIRRGVITDTSMGPDPTIVNPARLTATLRMEICQRCHLQGNAVLQSDMDFFSYRPGMALNEVMDVYLPRYAGAEDQFIMASHADRLQQSTCFKASKLDCTTCHNPHKSVRTLGSSHFNAQCTGCHATEKGVRCTEPEEKRAAAGNNCVSCHMPVSGSIDIPHVTVHDHKIGIHAGKETMESGGFLGLVAVNNPNPSIKSKIQAYLQQVERFNGAPYMLDSAERLLQGQKNADAEWVHLYFLKKDWIGLQQLILKRGTKPLLEQWNTADALNRPAWNCYRAAEGFIQGNQWNLATEFIDQAIQLAPYVPDFYQKKVIILVSQGQLDQAEALYVTLDSEFPPRAAVKSGYAYLKLVQGNMDAADALLKEAYQLDPDEPNVWQNRAAYHMAKGEEQQAKWWILRLLQRDPNNQRALQALKMLNS